MDHCGMLKLSQPKKSNYINIHHCVNPTVTFAQNHGPWAQKRHALHLAGQWSGRGAERGQANLARPLVCSNQLIRNESRRISWVEMLRYCTSWQTRTLYTDSPSLQSVSKRLGEASNSTCKGNHYDSFRRFLRFSQCQVQLCFNP